MDANIIPFLRASGRSREGLICVSVRAKVWSKLGSFDHYVPSGSGDTLDRMSAIRRPTPEFAEWMQDCLEGDIFYDAQYFDGEGVRRARWIMLFSHEADAVAFTLRWL